MVELRGPQRNAAIEIEGPDEETVDALDRGVA